MVPRCHGALLPWCDGALVPRCLGAMVPWCHGTLLPWCHGATVPRCYGALVPRCNVPRCLRDMVPWCLAARCHGALVARCCCAWCYGAIEPRCHSATVPWCHGALVSAQVGTVSRLSVYPASPVLLTKNGPLGAPDSVARPDKVATGPTPKSNERFACQYRCVPPPVFPLASPRSCIVHHLSGPNSQITLVHTSFELAVQRAGKAPEGTVPNPYPNWHAATRSYCRSISSSPLTADGFRTGTPMPSPQCQSFSRSYGAILQTFLAYIVPSTRVLFTKNGPLGALDSVARIDKAVARPTPKSDKRFACHYRCGPPSEFPLASPRSGIVHHFLGPNSFGQNSLPNLGCIPNQPNSYTVPHCATGFEQNGVLTFSGAPFQGTWAQSAAEDASPNYNSNDGAARF
ncbi:hypothetical protein T459_34619 [Capsicum annuum]|uniref:Uncharacterized protein n=1 Tax=Capsicum annuum TaxID=4072 RepID=A0A2G2XW25_CAPAN|nr:hypothetical protein T459_34619 [Capsicum annuum]